MFLKSLQGFRTVLIFSFLLCQFSFASTGSEDCESNLHSKEPEVLKDPVTHEYLGLSKTGLEAIQKARDTLRERLKIFNNKFRIMDSTHHAAMVARLAQENMFLYGPPGGSKSGVIDWMIKGESEPAFELQLHQMMTEQAFIGGQNFDAAKEGRFEINTKGSLADHKVGKIDETEKGNPAALGSLLSLLNERKIYAGNKVIDAQLETVYATSNASLPEIFQQFVENAQGTTAPAFLNRFLMKSFIYNWLPKEDQLFLDKRNAREKRLKAMSQMYPEVLKDQIFLNPDPIDWKMLRNLSEIMFQESNLYESSFIQVIDEMRTATNKAIRASEEALKTSHDEELFVYFPSGDASERWRQKITTIIKMSSMIDFLLSPLADDAVLKSIAKHPIELDPLSLWRAYLVLTTVGPGNAKLVYDPKTESKVDIDFSWNIDPSSSRDKREERLIENLRAEQRRFREEFTKELKKIKNNVEMAAKFSMFEKCVTNSLEEKSFELLLLQYSK